MNYWLLKTEPSTYSFDDLVKEKKTVWEGVASPKGLSNIRSMKKGDIAFIYHTGDEKQIIGTAEIISEPYPDPKLDDERMVVVDIKPVKKVKRPVTLREIKASGKFNDSPIAREPRLSVIPFSKQQWDELIKMSES